jgi:hypothetical protein
LCSAQLSVHHSCSNNLFYEHVWTKISLAELSRFAERKTLHYSMWLIIL